MAPLDWGLGHATRCIPIIYDLLSKGQEVTIASDGQPLALLKKEFPNLEILQLKGYNIQYSKSRKTFIFNILRQIPKISYAVIHEHIWLKRMLKKKKWDIIISDNRYGLFTKQKKTVIITHQLHVFSGMGEMIDRALQKIIYTFIQRFDKCWIPDLEGQFNVAGKLSHPYHLPQNASYIGLLSNKLPLSRPYKRKLLVILSGPEPQRSILEEKIIHQLSENPAETLLVRGLPASKEIPQVPERVTVLNYLGGDALSAAMAESEIIVCRAGYSSIMDLLKLGKKAMLVPTPGQTEQEYLGKYLLQHGLFMSCPQEKLDLNTLFQNIQETPKKIQEHEFEHFKKALLDFGI